MKWQLLIADADNTLFDFAAAERYALEMACQSQGLAFAPEYVAVFSRINDALWKALERGEVTQEVLRVRRCEEFLAALDLAGDALRFGEDFVDGLAQSAFLLPDAEETLRAAAQKLPVVILTNGIARVQRSRMARSPFGDVIHGLAISEEIGCAKPDPRTVFAAMEIGGVEDPSKVLLLGDSLSADIGAAQAAGVASCWFNPKGLPRPAEVQPTYEIRALPELLKLL